MAAYKFDINMSEAEIVTALMKQYGNELRKQLWGGHLSEWWRGSPFL